MIYSESKRLSIGMELEFQILERRSLDLSNGAVELLKSLPGNPYLRKELLQNTIEIASSPCDSIAQLENELRGQVSLLLEKSHERGLILCGAGTHAFSAQDGVPFPDERYETMSRSEGYAASQHIVFATHAHLGMTSAGQAVSTLSQLRDYLPVLVAISANSPFWRGKNTFHASYRHRVLAAARTYGVPPSFQSWSEWERFYEVALRSGVIRGLRDIHWHLRPRPDYGTIEVRAMDAQPTVSEAVDLGAFVRALAYYLQETHPEERPGMFPRLLPDWIERENLYRASHQGLAAPFIHDEDGGARSLLETILHLLEELEPAYQDLGDLAHLQSLRQRVENGGLGYHQQLRVFESSGSTHEVVRHLTRGLEDDLQAFLPGKVA